MKDNRVRADRECCTLPLTGLFGLAGKAKPAPLTRSVFQHIESGLHGRPVLSANALPIGSPAHCA